MKIDKYKQAVRFRGEDGEHLLVRYDNRGEPFQEGCSFDLDDGGGIRISLFLEKSEMKSLLKTLSVLSNAQTTFYDEYIRKDEED